MSTTLYKAEGNYMDLKAIDTPFLNCDLHELLPLYFVLVSGRSEETTWNQVIDAYHYLGYKKIPGKRLKYLVYTNQTRPVAAIGWKSGSRYLEVRDRFIGWSPECREKSLDHIATNIRFLIFPWIHVFNLGSYILKRSLQHLQKDWYAKYGKEIYMVETFINPAKHRGSCYRAANWSLLGKTKGYSKIRGGYIYHGQEKEVYVYVIRKNFRELLGCTTPWKPHTTIINHRWEDLQTMMFQNMNFNPELLDKEVLTAEMMDEIAQELCNFHYCFNSAFRRSEQLNHSVMYLKGLLSPLERKHIEGIALKLSEPDDVRGLQKFMKDSPWDDKLLYTIYLEELGKNISSPDGMFTIDSSETAKKGKESVGVAHQYCGNTGKKDNCQSGVFLGYAGSKGYGLLDRRLYMPEKWFSAEYEKRRNDCMVPPELKFKTKLEIALDLLKETKQNGIFRGKWVGCDAFYGSSGEFCDSVEGLGFWYFAAIRSNQLFWLEPPEIVPVTYGGRGKKPRDGAQKASCAPRAVSDIAKRDAIPWQSVVLAEGAKGPIVADIAIMKVIRCADKLPGKEVLLFIRKDADGSLHYYISNAPLEISNQELIQVATMRWSVEQCFEDGKKYLGMDHYEHRSWPAWHRHMLFVFLAMYFLLRLRIKYKKNSIEYLTSNEAVNTGNINYK
jgi:SRSO17 transposase